MAEHLAPVAEAPLPRQLMLEQLSKDTSPGSRLAAQHADIIDHHLYGPAYYDEDTGVSALVDHLPAGLDEDDVWNEGLATLLDLASKQNADVVSDEFADEAHMAVWAALEVQVFGESSHAVIDYQQTADLPDASPEALPAPLWLLESPHDEDPNVDRVLDNLTVQDIWTRVKHDPPVSAEIWDTFLAVDVYHTAENATEYAKQLDVTKATISRRRLKARDVLGVFFRDVEPAHRPVPEDVDASQQEPEAEPAPVDPDAMALHIGRLVIGHGYTIMDAGHSVVIHYGPDGMGRIQRVVSIELADMGADRRKDS